MHANVKDDISTEGAKQLFSDCTIDVTFNLPEDAAYIGFLRHQARVVMEGMNLPTQDIDDVAIVIAELASNAVRHAKGGYKVKLELCANQVCVVVVDTGVGFEPEAVPPVGASRPDGCSEVFSVRVGGFGLPLVHVLADEVQISKNQTGGMTVRVVKLLTKVS